MTINNISSTSQYNGPTQKIEPGQENVTAKDGVQSKFDPKEVEEAKKMATLVSLVSTKISQELAAIGMAVDKIALTPPNSKKNVESAINEISQKITTTNELTAADTARGIIRSEQNLNPLKIDKLTGQVLYSVSNGFNQINESVVNAEIEKHAKKLMISPEKARAFATDGLDIINQNPEKLKIEPKGRDFYNNAFATLFSALMQLALLIGRNASERNLQALQQNEEAGKRRNDAIIKQAKEEFTYALSGAMLNIGFSVAGGTHGAVNASQKYGLNKQHAHYLDGTSPASKNGYTRLNNYANGEFPNANEIHVNTAFRDMKFEKLNKWEAIVGTTAKSGEIFSGSVSGMGKVEGSAAQVEQNKAQSDSSSYTTSAEEAKKAQNEAQQIAESIINQFRNNMNNRETMLNQMANR